MCQAEAVYLLMLETTGEILREPSWCLAHALKHELEFSLANIFHLGSHSESRLIQFCPSPGTRNRTRAGSCTTDRCRQDGHCFSYSEILV